jgi:hypothetical protein
MKLSANIMVKNREQPENPKEPLLLEVLNNPQVYFNHKQAKKLRSLTEGKEEEEFFKRLQRYVDIRAKGTKDDILQSDVLLENIRSDIDLMMEGD